MDSDNKFEYLIEKLDAGEIHHIVTSKGKYKIELVEEFDKEEDAPVSEADNLH